MEPTRDEIHGQLDRVVASEPFVNAERVSRFLRYVVERTLAGEGDRLKEYVIGTEVFERGEQYDPRVDSIVRVEAGRLRTKLDEYYNGHGSSDPIVIRMPRGGYAPVFETRQLSSAVTPSRRTFRLAGATAAVFLLAIAAWGARYWAAAETSIPETTIAVLPFAHYSADDAVALLAARVTDGVTSELARVGTVGVVSHTSAMQVAGARRPLREVARSLNADVVMEASIETEGDHLRIVTRLVDGSSDRKFWVEEFAGTVGNVSELQRRVAAAAAAAATRRHR